MKAEWLVCIELPKELQTGDRGRGDEGYCAKGLSGCDKSAKAAAATASVLEMNM